MKQAQKIATSGFIQNSEGKFLIVKRAKDDDFLPGMWELPGGKLEFGEAVEKGARREIQEETDLDVIVKHPLTAISYIVEEPNKAEHHYVEITYFCKMENPEQEVKLSEEHEDFQWIGFEEIETIKFSSLMKDLLSTIKIHPLKIN